MWSIVFSSDSYGYANAILIDLGFISMPIQWFQDAKYVMPTLGRIFSKDTKAYEYLPESIAAFPQGEVMQKIIRNAGFSKVEFRRFTGGVCTFYLATK